MAPIYWAVTALFLCCQTALAVTAKSYIATDMNGQVLIEKNSNEVRSIASITKLFIAEKASNLDQDELIEVTKEDVIKGRMRSTPLRAGKSYTRRHLTELALVSSDNVAALALGRYLTSVQTDKAQLVEASGLSPSNQASAAQVAAAARELYSTQVAEISAMSRATVGERRSTNPLLHREGWVFLLSKTGFINQSGGCLVVIVEVKGQPVTIAILGSADTRERWRDLAKIRQLLGDDGFYVPVSVTSVKKKRK